MKMTRLRDLIASQPGITSADNYLKRQHFSEQFL